MDHDNFTELYSVIKLNILQHNYICTCINLQNKHRTHVTFISS